MELVRCCCSYIRIYSESTDDSISQTEYFEMTRSQVQAT